MFTRRLDVHVSMHIPVDEEIALALANLALAKAFVLEPGRVFHWIPFFDRRPLDVQMFGLPRSTFRPR